MAEKTTTKKINLYQLCVEMGEAPLRLIGAGMTTEPKTLRSTVAQSVLDAAVASHTADPAIVPPADPAVSRVADLRSKLAAALAANDAAIAQGEAFLATAKPSTAAAQASSAYDQAKVLTQGSNGIRRQLNALILLQLGALNSTAST